MSKKIINLQDKILQVASNLFRENDYQSVDMRRIAKDAGTAVGTIYNYFPNKETLYVAFFKGSWINTLQNLESITNSQQDPIERVIAFVFELYRGKEERKHLSKEIIFKTLSQCENKNALIDMKKEWRTTISSLMLKILEENKKLRSFEFDEIYYQELIDSIIFSALTVDDFSTDKEKLKSYIRQYIYKLLS